MVAGQRRFYRLCCSAASERGGQGSCMSFRWIWLAFASRPLRVLPRSENFSWYSLLVLNQPFEIAQILFESPRQIGRIEDRTDLQRYFGFLFRTRFEGDYARHEAV